MAGNGLSLTNGEWTYGLLEGFPASFGGPRDTPTLDAAGNVYLTSSGTGGNGSVVELIPSNGGWHSITLHAFSGIDGSIPMGGLILDANGNVYGTTEFGGENANGAVFEITP